MKATKMYLRSLSCLAGSLLITACEPKPSTSPLTVPAATIGHAPVTTAAPPHEIPAQAAATLAAPDAPSDPMDLAKRSGCFACHAIDRKVVGPPWRDVAARYKGDPEARQRLITKVHDGGKGNWTDVTGGVAMPAYSPRVTTADIERLVDFVLSLPEGGSPTP